MARSTSFKAFNRLNREIEAKILRTSTAFINRVSKQIEQEITVLNGAFFSSLISVGIDVETSPGLREFTPRWKPLKTNYARWKARKYPGSGFFKASGKLRASLNQAKGNLLGRPTVIVTKIPKAVKRGESFRIVVQPAPAMRRKTGMAVLDQINGGSGQRSMKLSAYKGKITRPLVEPYLNWWVKYVITPSVVRRLK
jgi:hypothetical protein